MEIKTITPEMKALLDKPLPQEAIKPHPSKSYLSTINSIYVTERLNDVFGVGKWQIHIEKLPQEPTEKMVVTKTSLDIPEYDIHLECFGGNDNNDRGDAYKGSTTDALTKMASWLGIGAHVWKNDPSGTKTTKQLTMRERIIAYLNKMDEKARKEYFDYFQITGINDITDAKADEIAEFEKQKKKKSKK